MERKNITHVRLHAWMKVLHAATMRGIDREIDREERLTQAKPRNMEIEYVATVVFLKRLTLSCGRFMRPENGEKIDETARSWEHACIFSRVTSVPDSTSTLRNIR